MDPTIEALRERTVVGPNGCWVWTGARSRGYGNVMVQGRYWRAHRLSWSMVNGPIPEGLLICHHCDNPPCVNPDHLFLGSYKDNVDDMLSKGRWHLGAPTVGGRNGNVKATQESVDEIFRLRGHGFLYRQIAAEVGLSIAQIGKILTFGTHWRPTP